MWKRVLTSAIAILFAIGSTGSVFADSTGSTSGNSGSAASGSTTIASGNAVNDKDVKISKDEAKRIALEQLKKYFGVDVDAKKYQESVQLSPYYEAENAYVWQLNWSSNSSTGYVHVNMEIDSSTGKLLSFSKSESIRNQQQLSVASITMEQARKLADEFLGKISPEDYSQAKLSEDNREIINPGMARPYYSFSYTREANGITYPENYLAVRLNGMDGSITSYHSRWDYDVSFPVAGKLIDSQKALSLFKTRIEMELNYIPVRNKTVRYIAPVGVKLSYSPNMENGFLLDAQSGEFINYNGEKSGEKKIKDITSEQKSKLASTRTQPLGAANEMGSEAAEVAINGLAKEFFGTGFRVVNLSYSENGALSPDENRKAWSAEVIEDKPEAYETKGNIIIDSTTGELLSIGRYLNEDWYGKEYERKLTWEQAYDKAVEVLTRYFPHKVGEIRTEQAYQENFMQVNGRMIPDRMLAFNFPRLVNGIRYYNDSINITVDTKTEEISDVYYRWGKNLDFPKPEGVINKAQAEEIFFSGFEVKAIYRKFTKKEAAGEYADDYRIVYTLELKDNDASRSIDAFTGKFLDNYGSEINTPKSSFNEVIKGHPSEKELSILAFQGVIDAANFEPAREMTYIELIKLLVNAKVYRPYTTTDPEELLFKNISREAEGYPYLLEAVRYEILENKPVELSLDAKVTREQMIELMIKLLGYEKLAKARDIFVLDYKDSKEINSQLTGHVAIARGLGIIDESVENFKPKENVKLDEAALTIYKVLNNLKEKR
ncbi:MAG TPA: YcdB/YcdC domain-containing protein [Candidatus Nitrosocosmicus sp.]|nr:YcdB/YcdC domain-containing protein [Candidatus Nitrosocosmicus sp.]